MGTYTNLFRAITKAKINRRPLLIVEGIDDKQFYENILLHIISTEEDNLASLYSIQAIQEVTIVNDTLGKSGCKAVVEEFKKIQDSFINDESLLQYCRGIIDRDSFHYVESEEKIEERNRLLGLFTLRYYSFECYGLTRKNLKEVIRKNSRLVMDEISSELLDLVEEQLKEKVYQDFYYIGLDCLKHEMDVEYRNVFAYGDSDKIKDYNFRRRKLEGIDRQKLEQLADTYNFQREIDSIKKFVKGKHLLKACAAELAFFIESQGKVCKDETSALTACTVSEICLAKFVNDNKRTNIPCKWQTDVSKQDRIIRIYQSLIYTIDFEEVYDIIEEFSNLALPLKPQYFQGA